MKKMNKTLETITILGIGALLATGFHNLIDYCGGYDGGVVPVVQELAKDTKSDGGSNAVAMNIWHKSQATAELYNVAAPMVSHNNCVIGSYANSRNEYFNGLGKYHHQSFKDISF